MVVFQERPGSPRVVVGDEDRHPVSEAHGRVYGVGSNRGCDPPGPQPGGDHLCLERLHSHQLDKLLAPQAAATQASGASPAPVAEADAPKVEPVETVATVEAAEPPPAVIASEAQEPEHTGSITPAAAPAEALTPAPVEEAAPVEAAPVEEAAPKND